MIRLFFFFFYQQDRWGKRTSTWTNCYRQHLPSFNGIWWSNPLEGGRVFGPSNTCWNSWSNGCNQAGTGAIPMLSSPFYMMVTISPPPCISCSSLYRVTSWVGLIEEAMITYGLPSHWNFIVIIFQSHYTGPNNSNHCMPNTKSSPLRGKE